MWPPIGDPKTKQGDETQLLFADATDFLTKTFTDHRDLCNAFTIVSKLENIIEMGRIIRLG
jgi:hypothetical protein